MTQQTISITRALTELKRSEDRIVQAVANGLFVSTTVGKDQKRKPTNLNVSIDEVTSKIQGSFDKVDQLITTRAELKSKIVLSNATTMVKILGRDMTVAEAIELKSTVALRKNYLRALSTQLTASKMLVEKKNVELEAAIDASLNQLYGSEKSKIDEASLKAVGEVQRQQKEMALLDPSKIEERIEVLTKEISDLETEVDYVLSEKNAQTTITVNF